MPLKFIELLRICCYLDDREIITKVRLLCRKIREITTDLRFLVKGRSWNVGFDNTRTCWLCKYAPRHLWAAS